MVQSEAKRLTRPGIKTVARTVLEALRVLYEGGYVHTDIKLDNVLVSYGQQTRFAEIKLGDCGSTVPVDSKWAKEGHAMSAPIWQSPEVILGLPWGPPTDIWSFGTLIIRLIYGDDWHIFDPTNDGIPFGHDEFQYTVLKKHHQFFGPFPTTYAEFVDEDAINLIIHAMETTPAEKPKPFHLVTEREIAKEDNVFLQNIMKLDARDRPTAKETLEDAWFADAN